MSAHPSISGLPLVLGGNVFGFTADEDTSFAILDRFYEAGGRMVDTAQGYSDWVPGHVGGESETVIGKWLAARGVRADMRIATKTGMHANPGDLDPVKVSDELHKSLERLQTDYVDLYYAHRDDKVTPLEEVATGFDALVKTGLVRELGASNYDAGRLAAIHTIAHSSGMTPFTVLQNEYNVVVRDSYGPTLQRLCTGRDIAMLPWFGLAGGFLTGKYRTRDDLARHNRGSSVERFFEQGLKVLPVLDAIVEETGASMAAISLAWLMRQPGIAAPIASASKPEQLDVQFEALKLELTEDQLARITEAGK
ncbi:aryl-alcohol dehydrogenase-like predicted oxidoreductase [Altererythrobacter atlanticus]|uniref:General stress protein 69 n=1 Tax=Croceibacterium atlanticum TaxID=1267766 RepID=A0A0F7KQW2_9SPHN|nr:aldo/keto reductase [Croceibacterium atlanticum]AKH41491.1 General stress protein 69 [Croceibacterium atlanticum]MBB5732953.1 aryl-alcohol dehydrogenase-like predicted oxidoreductase [Croceibacterium atlanticum]